MTIFLNKYGKNNTRNVISSKFYIENDYLDIFWGCFIAMENRNSLILELIEKKPKKSRFSEKSVSFRFQAHKTVKVVQKVYLDSHFWCKISRRIQPSEQNFWKSRGECGKWRFKRKKSSENPENRHKSKLNSILKVRVRTGVCLTSKCL